MRVHAPKRAEVLGDEHWLTQVVVNLLDNALKFTPEGGAVELNVESSESGICLAVKDTGPGIPDADLTRVFERFNQSDPSRTRGQKSGAGLDLAIAAWIVESHRARSPPRIAPSEEPTWRSTYPLGSNLRSRTSLPDGGIRFSARNGRSMNADTR